MSWFSWDAAGTAAAPDPASLAVIGPGAAAGNDPHTHIGVIGEIAGQAVVLKVEDNYLIQRDGLLRLTDAPYS
jgi:hypothetical protein